MSKECPVSTRLMGCKKHHVSYEAGRLVQEVEPTGDWTLHKDSDNIYLSQAAFPLPAMTLLLHDLSSEPDMNVFKLTGNENWKLNFGKSAFTATPPSTSTHSSTFKLEVEFRNGKPSFTMTGAWNLRTGPTDYTATAVSTFQPSEGNDLAPSSDMSNCNTTTKQLLPASHLPDRREGANDNAPRRNHTGSSRDENDPNSNDLNNSSEWIVVTGLVAESGEDSLCHSDDSDHTRSKDAASSTPVAGMENGEKANLTGEIEKSSDLVQKARPPPIVRIGNNMEFRDGKFQILPPRSTRNG